MTTLNFWPILVATIVAFGIGALWYSPVLFGHEWMTLTKLDDADLAESRARGMWKFYLTQLVATFVMFSVVGFIISDTAAFTALDGAFVGFLGWLGFTLTEAVGAMMWEKKPFKLAMIQIIGTLVNLVIGGAIIGAWR
jgi:uncharacterized membrane protein